MIRYPKQKPHSQYSHVKQGVREDLGDIFFRSGWEANYARYLNFLMENKVIHDWKYEATTFWFEGIKRGVRSYLPDFEVYETDFTLPYYVEVKGYMDAKSKTKINRMRIYNPDVKLVVVGKNEYAELAAKFAGIIKNWE